MDPLDKQKLITHTDMLVSSLSANSASYNKILDLFVASGILPEDTYEDLLVRTTDPRTIKQNIRDFITWMRKSPDSRCLDQFCVGLKEAGLTAELDLLLSTPATGAAAQGDDVPEVSPVF